MQVDDFGVDRVEYLRKRVDSQAASPHRTTFAVRFRGSPLDLPKVRVEVGFPRYRLANGRTRRKQEQYLVDHPELPADLFTDPASDLAQRAQHEILYEMAQEASLEQMLEDEGQRDPIVVTYDGFVVNGNRRLAIIREFDDVTHVEAVVLPEDADAKDISALEMRLQMAEDGKADYNWLDALLTIEANISEIGFTEEEVAREMGCYLKTIQLQRHELDLVNRYLNERGYPGEHFRVEGDKQAFETLARAHRDNPDSDRQANLRSLGFNIIAKPASGSSVHRQIEAMIRNLDTTVALINRQNGDAHKVADDEQLVSFDDLLSELDTDDKERAPVVNLPVSEESAAQVHDAIEEAKGLNEERSRAHEAAAQMKQAARYLSSVKISTHTADIDVIQGQLRAIDAECTRIREQLSALPGEP